MTVYGTIEFRQFYFGDEPTIEAVHLGSPLVRMSFEFWIAMKYGGDALKVGNSFELYNFNMKIIDIIPEENIIVVANKGAPFWRIAVLFYKIRRLKQ